jgi:ATP-binding cassette subfamily C (CFTR/MRP) protein 1
VISHYLSMASNRWLSTRIENIGNLIIFFTALFAVINRESLSPGLAALSITYALNVTMSVVWVVRMGCELENNCVALERIFEYTQNTPEAEWDILQDDQDSWPSQGLVEFNNYQTRYREGLDLVLKGVDLKINPKDKVGICGRTGAGKSSLTLALFRIIESTSGNIIIDGQDISHLGLHNLRSKLTIIPQVRSA